jgi:vacuolar-type H+-ATPase subunit I/STV1
MTYQEGNTKRSSLSAIMMLQMIIMPQHCALSFSALPTLSKQENMQLHATSPNIDDDISKQLERARQLLAKSKAKIEAKEKDEEELSSVEKESKDVVPFFAAKDETADKSNKKEKLTKNKNEETGLSTFDGDMMAELSEEEEWQVRPLQEVFEDEKEEKARDPFGDRDVAASIFNLRRTLQTEDYQRIFDKRNRFIGEQ